jgi:hypothetical protein
MAIPPKVVIVLLYSLTNFSQTIRWDYEEHVLLHREHPFCNIDPDRSVRGSP